MLGAVCESGITWPLCSRPASGVPGLTSTVMSCSWVFGRSSNVALRYRWAYFGVMFIVTTATPWFRSTRAISPIFAPAIVTA